MNVIHNVTKIWMICVSDKKMFQLKCYVYFCTIFSPTSFLWNVISFIHSLFLFRVCSIVASVGFFFLFSFICGYRSRVTSLFCPVPPRLWPSIHFIPLPTSLSPIKCKFSIVYMINSSDTYIHVMLLCGESNTLSAGCHSWQHSFEIAPFSWLAG